MSYRQGRPDGKTGDRRDVHRFLATKIGERPVCPHVFDYFPYGGEIPIINNDSNRYKFTGKERDAESGLDNFDVRYYGSSLGRFMKPDDPLVWIDQSNPQSLNLYAYGLNNPTSNADDGHDCVYLNNAGNGVESVDQNSSSGECGNNGG